MQFQKFLNQLIYTCSIFCHVGILPIAACACFFSLFPSFLASFPSGLRPFVFISKDDKNILWLFHKPKRINEHWKRIVAFHMEEWSHGWAISNVVEVSIGFNCLLRYSIHFSLLRTDMAPLNQDPLGSKHLSEGYREMIWVWLSAAIRHNYNPSF